MELIICFMLLATLWLIDCIGYFVKEYAVCGSMKESDEDGKLKSESEGDGLEMGTAETNQHCNLDKAMAERESDEETEDKDHDENASPTSKEDENQLQELTAKFDDQDDDVEMLRASLEKERQYLAWDLVELANVLTQKLRDCERVLMEERRGKWEEEKEEKEGLKLTIAKLTELYLDKERSHRQDVLLHDQERNELSRKLMDATWGHQNFRLLYKRSVQEKRELAAKLDHAIKYYQAYCHETCKLKEAENTLLYAKLSELEDRCSRLEEDKQNLTASLETAEANILIYKSYLPDLFI